MGEFSVRRGATLISGSDDGTGPPIVFLHAGVADRRSWADVIARLCDDFRCLAYDQRGYGNTTSDTEPFSAVDDLLAVIADAGIDRAVLVGASRGGQIALDAALIAPAHVAALVLIGSAPHDAPSAPIPDEILALFDQIEAADEAGDLARVNELETRVWLDGPLATPGRVSGPLRELFLDMNGRALAAEPIGDRLPFSPAWDATRTLDIPVSVIVGDLDLPGLRSAAEATAARIPGARFATLAGTAHMPMLEQPAAIATAIRDLVGRVGVTGR